MERATSHNLKDEIVSQAQQCFYEYGYKGTTYAKLSKMLSVSPGSISYHFASKAELASEVHRNYVRKIDEQVQSWLLNNQGFFSPLIDYVMQILIGLKMYGEDEKAFRFYGEFAKTDFEKALFSGASPFFPPYLRQEDLDTSQDEQMLFSAAYKSMAIALNVVFFSGEVKTDINFFTEYKIKTLLRFAHIPEDVIAKTLDQCLGYFEEMDIELLPAFRIKMRSGVS